MSDLKQELLDATFEAAARLKAANWAGSALHLEALRARLERAVVTEPQPTNEELLDTLRRELGDGPWYANPFRDGYFHVRCDDLVTCLVAIPGYQVLRQPNGIKRTAEALRWLALLPKVEGASQ